jgi:ribonuclease P protein component
MPHLQLLTETLSGFEAFTRVITRGKRFEDKPIKAFVCLSVSPEPMVRVGYAVTRGIKKATQRNRVKRLMREAFRANKRNFFGSINSGRLLEIVFMYNDGKETAPKKIHMESVNKALSTVCSLIEKAGNSNK